MSDQIDTPPATQPTADTGTVPARTALFALVLSIAAIEFVTPLHPAGLLAAQLIVPLAFATRAQMVVIDVQDLP